MNMLLTLQVDVTHLIEGHSSYLWATQQVLDQLELDTYFPVFRSNIDKKQGFLQIQFMLQVILGALSFEYSKLGVYCFIVLLHTINASSGMSFTY